MISSKAQSAMEYLMTYGWAILIVAVVLGALYSLGVFGGANFLGGTCVASPGYLCSNPLLATDGTLSIVYGYQGPNVTIVGFGCSTAKSEPNTFTASGTSNLAPGQQETVQISCPLSSTATIGTSFSGYLWVEYDQGGKSGLVAQFATISLPVSTLSSACSGSVEAYVPIQITNGASAATQTTFQQELSVATGSYASYTTSNLYNVCFSTEPNGSGSALQSWVETDTGTDTVWVKLTTSIPAGGSQIIYMNFMSANQMSTTGPTGEAPQLSTPYAEYDNGGKVFNFYDNFTGTSLNTNKWTSILTGGYGSITVDNGITLDSNAGSGWVGPGILSASTFNPATNVEDMYATSVSGSGDFAQDWIYPAPVTGSCAGNNGLDCVVSGGTTEGYAMTYRTWAGTFAIQGYGPGGMDNQNEQGCSSPTSPATLIWNLSLTDNEIGQNGYSSCLYGPSLANAPMQNSYALLVAQYDPTSVAIQWFRIRTMPPMGTMPSTTFESLVTG